MQTRGLVLVLAMMSACAGNGGGDTVDGSEGSSGGTSVGTPTEGGDPSGSPGGDPSTPEGGVESVGESAADSSEGGDESGPAPVVCADDCHYVRAGAGGSGASWDDALDELPEALERGHVYFVGAGSYPGYAFDDEGEAPIRVLRATAADHGADEGWDPAYADGLAELGPVVFAASFVELDGRGATRIVGTFESTVVDIAANDVTLRGCDVDGAFVLDGEQQSDGACTGINVAGDGVVIADNVIHDAADDGVVVSGSTAFVLAGNTIRALHGCGTDGGCGPCYNGHSDGIELYDVADSELVGNLVYDVASTSNLFFGNWADELGMGESEYCENIVVANNIFYAPETGFVAYIEDVRGVQLVSNVLWGRRQGAYGGLSIGVNVSDLDVFDNAIVSINYEHIGGSHDPAEHRGDYNLFAVSLGQWVDGAHDVVASDPAFAVVPGADDEPIEAPTAADFAPQTGSPLVDAGWAGDAAVAIPATDFFGNPRDDPPNIGAIE